MEHHFHFGVEHAAWIGLVAMIFRYIWKLLAAKMAASGGFLGQAGLAMGGIAQ